MANIRRNNVSCKYYRKKVVFSGYLLKVWGIKRQRTTINNN